ncbi:MAG: TonB-dependent siderophore receptor, partial [Comamonadaceae bacterium]
LACALTAPAHAQPATPAATVRSYDVPAQTLGSALARIAAHSGQQISIDADLVRGRAAPAVHGDYTAEQAAQAALHGSGLQLVRTGEGNWAVRLQAPQAAHTPSAMGQTLATVTVSGKAPGSTTEGTGSYTTFSTSSSTRLNLTPQETPQPISVITRQRIEDQGLVSLNDVMEATPGITVKAFGVGADGPQIWARGASITNFQIDGIPSATSMSNYLQSSVLYDRVEVVKGATGMMSGLGTPSATINMIRKRPTKEAQSSMTAEAGNWSRYGAGADLSRPLNDDASVRARLVADYKRQGAWADHYRQDYAVLYGIVEADLAPRTLLTAGFAHIDRKTNAPMRAFPIEYADGQPTHARPSDSVTPDWSYYDHRHDSVFASLERTLESGFSAKAELTHARYTYDAVIASLTGTLNQDGTGLMAQSPLWANTAEQTSLDAYLTGPFSLLGRRHEVIGGVTLSRVAQESPGYPVVRQSASGLFGWADTTPEPRFTQSGESDSTEYQYGAYLSSRLQLSDATNVLLGGRLTNWKRDTASLTYATAAAAQVSTQSHTRERNAFIPYLGIVHALNDTYSLYASYTKIFRPQDSGTLRYSQTGAMDPEEGMSYEAGLKASFQDGALTSSLSLFRTQQDNLALWNPALYIYEAENDATTEGAELELNGQLSPGWQLSAGYTYSESHNQDGGRIMTRIPRNTLKLFTTYRLTGALNRLTLGGGMNWESRTGDPLRTYTQNSYAVVNLMARYELSPELSISAYLNNALDKRYFAALAGTNGMFGPPRNFMVSMKYKF